MAWGLVEIAESCMEMRTRDRRPPTVVKYVNCRWQNLSSVYLAEQLMHLSGFSLCIDFYFALFQKLNNLLSVPVHWNDYFKPTTAQLPKIN
jgi:hypothetical protein